MGRRFPGLLLSVLVASSSFSSFCDAQQQISQDTISPKLRDFLAGHLQASLLLSNICSEAFENRRVRLIYFYTDDESVPKASHYYSEYSTVTIVVRENQEPVDEFTCVVYETVNSENEKQFKEIWRNARAGKVKREDFAVSILKLEFKAAKRTRDLLKGMELSDDLSKSSEYKHFLGCPDTFNDFLVYLKKPGIARNPGPLTFYETQFDALTKTNAINP